MGWTKRSYDKLFDWGDKSKRDAVRKVLLAAGLDEVVSRLDAAQNLAVWYGITNEAAAAVGAEAVEQSAVEAERELNTAAQALGRKGGQAKTEAKIEASRTNGAKGGRPVSTTKYRITSRTGDSYWHDCSAKTLSGAKAAAGRMYQESFQGTIEVGIAAADTSTEIVSIKRGFGRWVDIP